MEETVTIFKFRSVDAVKSINDLKENIKTLKNALGAMDIGTQEYMDTLNELKENQNALKDAMYATSATMDEVAASATGASESYNSLVNRMAALKEEFRSTNDEARRNELGAQIKSVNDRLKEMDAMQGNYQRNVGNYASAIDGLSDAFKKTAGGAGSIINPVKGATTAFKTLSATPVVAILGILANIISKVMQEMKKSEEATGKLTGAFAGFKAIGDLVTAMLQKVGEVVAWVIGGISKFISAVVGASDAQQKRLEITKQEIALAQKQRETTIKNAEAELEIAKLREKASDAMLYTAAERLEFQKQAGDLEKEIAYRAYEDLKKQYEIIKAKNALSASTAEEKRKEADAYAAMIKAETDYFNRVANTNRQIKQLRNESIKEAQDAIKARISAEKDLINQELELTEKGTDQELQLRKEARKKDYDLAVAEAKAKIRNRTTLNKTLMMLEQKYQRDLEKLDREHQKTIEAQQVKHLQNMANQYAKGSTEYLTAMVALRKQEMEQIQKEVGETDVDFNARRLTAQQNYYTAVRALNDKHFKDATAELRLALSKEMGESEGYYAGLITLAQSNYDNLRKLEGENDTEFAIRKQESYKALKKAEQDYLDFVDGQEKLRLENRVNSFQEGTIPYQQAVIDLHKWELDQIVTYGKLETETEEEFLARKLAAEKAYTDSKKALIKQQVAMMQGVASTTSSILGSIADLYENDTENSERNANKIKALRIAAATIDTISGAIGAFMQASETIPPPYGQIVGAASAAAVTASGIAEIAKIKNTKVSANGGSGSTTRSSAVATAPTLTTQVANVRTLTSASEEDRLNQMASDQRVYILSSDIEASQNQIKTQVQESSF